MSSPSFVGTAAVGTGTQIGLYRARLVPVVAAKTFNKCRIPYKQYNFLRKTRLRKVPATEEGIYTAG